MLTIEKMDLEKYIKENRADFDCEEPSEGLWARIENKLPEPQTVKPKVFSLRKTFRMAASIVFLIGIGYLIGQYWRPVTEQSEIAKLSPKYAKEVMQYTKFIDEKRSELKRLTSENPALFKDFATELNDLENEYKSLKNSLPKNPNQEELLGAMIINLEWQLNILNQQLEVIRKINEDTDEKSTELA
ncbi:MAG: putative RNase H-like nuclease (RuvC/YqgF family) [Spirosomataceae bacterium]|jgi:predicted RNase H-like nuclease (RuvC/YqgF family)